MKKTEIKKGIELSMICDKKFKEFRACVLIHRPLSRGEVTKNSLMTAVMRMQSGNYPDATAVSTALEELYGADMTARASKYGEEQIIKVGIQAVSSSVIGKGDNFGSALCLLFDIAFNAGKNGGFSEQIFENERENIKNAILSQQNDKRSYSVLRLQEEMCKDEPYGINPVGYTEELAKISAEGLYSHYQSVLAESRIDIIFTGNFDESEAIEAAALYTKNLSPRDGGITLPVIKSEAGEVKTVTDRLDVTQGKLCMGFRCTNEMTPETYPAVIVYNTLFGGSAISKLFNNVREKLSLCYYVNSNIDRLKRIMIVRSGVEFENFGKAYDEIMLQQQLTENGEFDDAEIDAAKKQLINAYKSNYDSIGAMGEYNTMQLIMGTDVPISEMIERIQNVTREEIVSAAKSMKLDTVYMLKSDKEAE